MYSHTTVVELKLNLTLQIIGYLYYNIIRIMPQRKWTLRKNDTNTGKI